MNLIGWPKAPNHPASQSAVYPVLVNATTKAYLIMSFIIFVGYKTILIRTQRWPDA